MTCKQCRSKHVNNAVVKHVNNAVAKYVNNAVEKICTLL